MFSDIDGYIIFRKMFDLRAGLARSRKEEGKEPGKPQDSGFSPKSIARNVLEIDMMEAPIAC